MKNNTIKKVFPTGLPVSGSEFAGRKTENKKIKELLLHGQSVILYGQRRIGKTSIALKILKELKQKGFLIGHVDLFSTDSQRSFAEKLTETTLKNKKLSSIVDSLKSSLSKAFANVEIKQTIDNFEWILKFAEQNTTDFDLLDHALDFPEEFAKKNKTPMIMFIDEIGDVNKLNGNKLIKLMRSKFQLHSSVTYLFAGSYKSVIDNIFVKESGPFYRFGQLVPINSIDKTDFSSFISNKFDKLKISITKNAIDFLLKVTDGHPYYTQLICRESYFLALSNKTKINSDIVKNAIDEAVLIESPYFSKIWEEIKGNSAQIKILKKVVFNKEPLYNYKTLNVSRTLNQLVKNTLILKENNGRYRIADPLFAIFLKKIFE